MIPSAVQRVMSLYPRIFFACHSRHVRDPASRRVISSHQASILDHLDPAEPTHLADLAAHMGVTPSTMSITVDRLVRGGFVRRVRDRADSRRVSLRLSPAGVRIRQAQTVLDPARVGAMLRHLTKPQLAKALDGLALLADAAQQEMRHKVLYGLRPRRAKASAGRSKGGLHA